MSDLYEQVRAVGTPRTTKAEMIEFYQSQYPASGRGSWKQHLVHDLSQVTGIKPKSLEKRFDLQRRDNPELRNAAQYQELGELIPTMPPEGGYHITGFVWVKFSEGECEEREVDEDITGKDAENLANAAEQDVAQRVVNHYMIEDDTEEPTASIGDCQPPDLTVDPIE